MQSMTGTKQDRGSGSDARTVAREARRPRNRLTVRARLALTYAVLVTVAGIVLLAIVSVFVGLLPNYSFGIITPASEVAFPTESVEPAMPTEPALPAPAENGSTDGTYGSPNSPDPSGYEIVLDPGLISSPAMALTVSSRADMLQLLIGVSAVALVLLAGAGAWAGWIIAGRMLRPLQYVNTAAHQAAAGHLDHRIALTGPRDEITELADTFDNMLGEIERSVDSHRRFAANASHELRTPLATTRTMLDVALSSLQSQDVQDPQAELLHRLRETNERSIETVESLLDLAEIQAGDVEVETVEIDALAESVVDSLSDEAEDAGVEIGLDLDAVSVQGDKVLLRQLLSNLVQNAIRHNECGGSATVHARYAADTVVLEVSNAGPKITRETVDQFVDPFYRGKGRTIAASARGRGLGLSIVSAIVGRHEGTLELEPRESGGLIVRVNLPRTSDHGSA